MPFLKRLLNKRFKWLALAALFPLWGIGAVELLVKSVHDLPYAQDFGPTLMPESSVVSFCVALAFMSIGMASTLKLIWQAQAERAQRLDILRLALDVGREAEVDGDYDSVPNGNHGTAASEGISYTRLWYLSFQNHLFAKSGFDTMQLTPLKRWPGVLKNQLDQDLVPVWHLPLLLISLVTIPVLALLIAALDLVLRCLTGVSFCDLSFQIVSAIAMIVSNLISGFPIQISICAFVALAVLVIPRIRALIVRLKTANNELLAARNSVDFNSLVPDDSDAPAGQGIRPV